MRHCRISFLGIALALTLAIAAPGQQVPDPDFDTSVANPAYTSDGPRVLFDEAHNNFHTAEGNYKPFADLITADGYRVTPNTKRKFTRGLLSHYDILVSANARGSSVTSDPAFTNAECDAVRDWVGKGGTLLLISDHAPTGAANERLSLRFGVAMSKGFTIDTLHTPPEDNNLTYIVYTSESGLAAHPITAGRDDSERVGYVIAFTGQSLKGLVQSDAFLQLSDTALDIIDGVLVPAAGRAQGVALSFGYGRVVVMGEAAMLTAQLFGPDRTPVGMNRPGVDNRQLALNIMHWLSGLI